LSYNFCIGKGRVAAEYQAGATTTYTYAFHELATTVAVDIFPFEPTSVAVTDGSSLQLTTTAQKLTVQVRNQAGKLLLNQVVKPSAARLAQQRQSTAILAGVHFAQPLDVKQHPVVK
jgi:predicted molibdopterin-dependent oxidoreductase YjgC